MIPSCTTLDARAAVAGLAIEGLTLIKENAYCHIFRGISGGEPLIVKRYKGDDPALAAAEAAAIDRYGDLARDDPGLLPSRTVFFDPGRNLLGIQFVPGERLSALVYRARRDADAMERACRLLAKLGSVCRRLHDLTATPGADTSPFIYEYFAHCSRSLESLPLVGRMTFWGLSDDGARIARRFRDSDVDPTFIHGDLVFRNIHVSGDRLGLLDFANTNDRSHTLNDVHNLRISLGAMLLPRGMAGRLWAGFLEGLGPLPCPPVADEFYAEYHRRRWLMLKLRTRDPRSWAHAFIGLRSFARAGEARNPFR